LCGPSRSASTSRLQQLLTPNSTSEQRRYKGKKLSTTPAATNTPNNSYHTTSFKAYYDWKPTVYIHYKRNPTTYLQRYHRTTIIYIVPGKTPPTSTVYHTNLPARRQNKPRLPTSIYKRVTELWGSATYHVTFSKWTQLLHNTTTAQLDLINTPSYNKTIVILKINVNHEIS